MRCLILSAIVALGMSPVAAAQPALEQLEKRVRSQLDAPGADSSVPPPAPKATPSAPTEKAEGKAEPAGEGKAEMIPPPAPVPAAARGHLGVTVDDVDDRGRGVRILRVQPGSPAEKAGLRAQDLITGLGGVRVRQLRDAAMILKQVPPGGALTVEVLRDGAAQDRRCLRSPLRFVGSSPRAPRIAGRDHSSAPAETAPARSGSRSGRAPRSPGSHRSAPTACAIIGAAGRRAGASAETAE